MRIAMWSGPRNLSTAMMYSFGARSDCAVWDEPFYAAYLAKTGLAHPLLDDILAAGETDPDRVASRCSGPIPDDKRYFYQKQMTHHVLPDFPRHWFEAVTHVFLIRDPVRVLASYHARLENPRLDDIGFIQQAEIFDQVCALTGKIPVVVDSHDILQNPHSMMEKLCQAIGIPFDPAMLNWPAGGHKGDGAWASYWYKSVWKSTGFGPPEGPLPQLHSEQAQAIVDEARPSYERLQEVKLTL